MAQWNKDQQGYLSNNSTLFEGVVLVNPTTGVPYTAGGGGGGGPASDVVITDVGTLAFDGVVLDVNIASQTNPLTIDTTTPLNVNLSTDSLAGPIDITGSVSVSNFPDPINVNLAQDSLAAPIDVNVTNQISEPLSVNLAGAIEPGGQPVLDAFGRWRTSNPFTLFDSKQLHNKLQFFYDEVLNGTATSTFAPGDGSTVLSVSANADYAIRETKMRFNYQPGKSQQIYMTMVVGDQVANTEKRIGYFNSDQNATPTVPYNTGFDGIYLYDDGTNVNWVLAKGDGTNAVEEIISQTNWNIDPLDGTGVSGVDLDWTVAQLMVIDFEWLGVGKVRCGFVVDGVTVFAHEFRNANKAGLTHVYMSSPNHSLRYEARSTGGATSLVHICSSVMSEGGAQDTGIVFFASTEGAAMNVTTTGTTYGVFGLRLRSAAPNIYSDVTAKLLDFVLQIQSGGDSGVWSLLFNPTYVENGIGNGTFTWNPINADSAVEYAVPTTPVGGGQSPASTIPIITPGTGLPFNGGYASSSVSGSSEVAGNVFKEIPSTPNLGTMIDGTPDEIIVTYRAVTSATNQAPHIIEAGLTWRELI
jgi:hypothetical protein